MAANQISNQRNKLGGQQQGAPSKRKQSAMSEEPQHDYGSMGELAEQASDYVERGRSHVRELARGREGAAVAIAFAAGLGVGLAIGGGLVRSYRQPRTWRDRLTEEGLGRRLMDRLERMVPDALAEHFAK